MLFGLRIKLFLIAVCFSSDFNDLQGWISHLGNPNLKEEKDGLFWAWELINEAISNDDEDDYILKFNEKFVSQIKEMFNQLLIDSPIGQLNFYQRLAIRHERCEKI